MDFQISFLSGQEKITTAFSTFLVEKNFSLLLCSPGDAFLPKIAVNIAHMHRAMHTLFITGISVIIRETRVKSLLVTYERNKI